MQHAKTIAQRQKPLLQRMLDFLATHDEPSWPANSPRDRLVFGGDDPLEFDAAIATLIARGVVTTHFGARGALHLDRVTATSEPKLFIAVVALIDDDGNVEPHNVFTFIVPHEDLDEETLLEQVASEMNAREHTANEAMDADPNATPNDADWDGDSIHGQYRVVSVVQSPAMFVVGG